MSVPVQPSCKRRLQILDDETRDASRFEPDAHEGMSASEQVWLKDFMVRLAASVRSLRGRP